jgi:hypothetical protein
MKARTKIESGGMSLNHNDARTKTATRKKLTIRSGVRAGYLEGAPGG